ncbi:MAG: nucleotidyltransferase family protein [Planctomycetes bacterium]|nr:nucleotidyltransferase family protein [Planctomycetota bacterium]
MVATNDIKDRIAGRRDFLASEFSVKSIGIFGSYSRGEAREDSDVDILVEFSETPGLFKFIELEEYLEEILGVKVDLVTKNALRPRMAKKILDEVIYV